MPAWHYFVKPTNLAFHDLRSSQTSTLPRNIISLLGLGLKFCPVAKVTCTNNDIATTLSRHQRDLWLKHYFKTHDNPASFDDNNVNLRLYTKSKWIPPPLGDP